MRNSDVARVMEEIGGLMRLRGDNTFKIRVYENAARAIRELNEPLDRLLAEGRLRAVPGIGAAIEKKIADYAATGSVPLHQKLLDEIPASALELLEVPGLGPRRARAAYAEAGIDSLDALEAAAIDGRLAKVSGFGPRSVETILAALAQVRRHAGRHLGHDARPLAEILAEWLGAREEVERAEVAGDLRRRHRLDLDWRLHRAATERGIKLAIDPDAHGPRQFEPLLATGIEIARKGWVTAADTLNALGPAEFRPALRRNRG